MGGGTQKDFRQMQKRKFLYPHAKITRITPLIGAPFFGPPWWLVVVYPKAVIRSSSDYMVMDGKNSWPEAVRLAVESVGDKYVPVGPEYTH